MVQIVDNELVSMLSSCPWPRSNTRTSIWQPFDACGSYVKSGNVLLMLMRFDNFENDNDQGVLLSIRDTSKHAANAGLSIIMFNFNVPQGCTCP